MSVRILVGDVFARLAEIPDNSVDCVVTSPPYWGLRDYGVEGQIGMEATLGALVIDSEASSKHVICPAQTGATDCCGTCGLCWAMDRPIEFVRH